ncbi:DUF4209 domain-containing protein [Bradyrhizobium sp. 172]|uniref:DUF4209 domain-containing protein n=1 Tax=Bradyrhizobium sp. 172 TaxID=2782643 RepID=UPI001FFE2F86|nr:DUF4209 domain-containing protein [Bradyrhizobium sp. 172]UPJ95040.1 hypothetical protein IVB07_32675 [Bradyrhizobium sp. 172]
MDNEKNGDAEPQRSDPAETFPPVWLRATLADLADLEFESPIAESKSADSQELGDLFRKAAGETEDTPAARVFRMLSAVAGMLFRPKDRSEPFGAMMVWADGRRSPVAGDFRGPPVEVLSAMAQRATHPALRARLSDLCWFLERRRADSGTAAVAAYVEILRKVDSGALAFRFDDGKGALKHDARDLLRRALQLGRAVGWNKPEAIAARAIANELRVRAIQNSLAVPAFWFCELDLDFGISDPAVIGKDIEDLIGALPAETDAHSIVELWRLGARAYHLAKQPDDQHRCQSAAADQFVLMADRQPVAMMTSSMLANAIAELHGVPGKKDRRKELRHRLIDAQAGIGEEMSGFSIPFNLEDMARQIEQGVKRQPTLRDKLFVFAALENSPEPRELAEAASDSIREHPLASLFGTSHHDSEGKVVHRTAGAGFGDEGDASAIQHQIAQDERIRRQVAAAGKIETARQAIGADHFLSDDIFARILVHSAFVPNDLVRTFSRGFLRFFQGDFVSALYILTPLLENSLRHVLKAHGHDVTIFDDANQTQQDRTISSLFEQMRNELDTIFGTAITADIERLFLKKPGPSLRHALSHGLLHDGDPYGPDAVYACWLIFRLCLIPLFPYREQLQLPFDKQAPSHP